MIPRTVLMAKAVEAIFSSAELDQYGNIILNGYASTVPNTTGKLAWQYKETTTAPVNLPSLTSVRPALKGWTTNYQEYYTQLQPNGYGVNPGDPTMFEYSVHSFTEASGVILTLGTLQAGYGYTPGIYTNVATFGGSGSGATLDITVDANGVVISAAINNPGTDYTVGDGLGTTAIGLGTGFAVAVAITTIVNPAGESKWAQAPRRLISNGVAPFVPPNTNQQAIPYSAILYPVADRTDEPPIGSL